MTHFLHTPRTDAGDLTRHTQNDNSFSIEDSFQAPAGRDNLFKQTSGARTPRNPLATLRNTNGRPEFTPMLKSTTANRTRQINDIMNGKITTPAAMKPGFEMSNTPLPEASMFEMQSSSFAHSVDGRTPVPHLDSSAMSTPIALPRRAEGELDNGNGNVLTLREQEARLEQIDKENFGLKLKIHFLEENLKKMGPEFNVKALEENINLKSEKVTMSRDIKNYSKDLKAAETELETYKQQLREYVEKVKRRHADEGMREEMDELRQLTEERAAEIERLTADLDDARSTEELDELRQLAEDREAEIERLTEKLDNTRSAEEIDELRQLAEERAIEIKRLKADLDDARSAEEVDELRQLVEERATVIERLTAKLDDARSAEDELEKISAELEDAQAELARRDKLLDEHEIHIEELEDKLKNAQGSQYADLAEKDRQEQQQAKIIDKLEHELRSMKCSKDAIIDSIQARLDVELSSKSSELCRLEQQLLHTTVELQEQTQKRHELSIEVAEARKERDSYHGQIQRDNHDDQTQRENYRKQIRELEDNLKNVSVELAEAQMECDSYRGQIQRDNHGDQTQRENYRKEIQGLESKLKNASVKLAEAQTERDSYRGQIQRDNHSDQTARENHRNQIRDLEDELDVVMEQVEVGSKEKASLENIIRELRSHIREKDSKLRLTQAASKAVQQKASQDAIDLDEQAETLTKRHIKEINGLAKQIQFLNARCARAEVFRDALSYQKRFFLMQIQMYNECNKEDLKLISQMGITPDVSVHERRRSLKFVALAVVATIRMQKLAYEWAQNRKLHELLKSKLESMRRGSGRRSKAPMLKVTRN